MDCSWNPPHLLRAQPVPQPAVTAYQFHWSGARDRRSAGFGGHECLDIAVELGDRFMIAESYEERIDTESDPVRARHYTEKHLALRLELGDLVGQIIAHIYMAINEFWSRNQVQARQTVNQSGHGNCKHRKKTNGD
jgi:hypothetical protein